MCFSLSPPDAVVFAPALPLSLSSVRHYVSCRAAGFIHACQTVLQVSCQFVILASQRHCIITQWAKRWRQLQACEQTPKKSVLNNFRPLSPTVSKGDDLLTALYNFPRGCHFSLHLNSSRKADIFHL